MLRVLFYDDDLSRPSKEAFENIRAYLTALEDALPNNVFIDRYHDPRDALAAVEAKQANKPLMLILDLHTTSRTRRLDLKDQHCGQTIAERAAVLWPDVPIVFLTHLKDALVRRRAGEVSTYIDFVSKDVSHGPETLRTTCQRVLRSIEKLRQGTSPVLEVGRLRVDPRTFKVAWRGVELTTALRLPLEDPSDPDSNAPAMLTRSVESKQLGAPSPLKLTEAEEIAATTVKLSAKETKLVITLLQLGLDRKSNSRSPSVTFDELLQGEARDDNNVYFRMNRIKRKLSAVEKYLFGLPRLTRDDLFVAMDRAYTIVEPHPTPALSFLALPPNGK